MAQDKMVNGEVPHSVTVDHLLAYPLLGQSFDFFQKQPLGAKSLDIANAFYARTSPYFATPASYIAPYAQKVDGLGDATLKKVDEFVPQIKQTDFQTVHSYATWPFSYVRDTYSDEYSKASKQDGEGLVSLAKAFLTTELRITSDTLHKIGDFFGPQRDNAKEKLEQFKGYSSEKLEQAKGLGSEKTEQAKGYGEQAKGYGQEKADQTKQNAEQAKDTASQKAEQTKKTANQKANGSA